MLENKLDLMQGTNVIIVRPVFGTQSDSYCGQISTAGKLVDMLKFQVQCVGICILFTAMDVSATELVNDGKISLIIRLKGPNDYGHA